MCKLFAVSDARNVTITNTLLNNLKEALCEYDRDGFGYSVQGAKGVFGERTTDTVSRFRSRFQAGHKTEKLSFVESTANRFGRKSEITGSLIAHGRMSTNTKSLECTHPYVHKQTSLIHNGVVTDLARTPIHVTTANDTEILLRYWLKSGITGITDNVGGYYALAIQDDGHLHLVKDDRAKLVASWSDVIESWVFATNSDILMDVSDVMGWKIEAPEKVKDNVYFVLKGNEVVFESRIDTIKAEISAEKQALSLGSVIEPQTLTEADWSRDFSRYDYNDGSLDPVAEIAKLDGGAYA